MKNIKLLYLISLIIILFVSCSKDNYMDTISDKFLSIPDTSFEKILIAKGIDSDGVVNQQMLKSDAETVLELDLGILEYGAIHDISGIEGFTSLKRLYANQHNIEQIDLSANILLEEIYLAGNNLSSINVSKNTNLVLLDLIATESVVTKNIEPYTIAGGNPAKEIKKRFDKNTVEKLLNLKWWNWDIDTITKNVQKLTTSPNDFFNEFNI